MQYYLYPEKTHIAASTIDGSTFDALKVGCHIWTKHVPAWYSIPDDGIPRYREFDDEFQPKLDAYLQSGSKAPKWLKKERGWWAGMLPGDAPDYSAIKGPDTLTMADLWDDPTKVRRPE